MVSVGQDPLPPGGPWVNKGALGDGYRVVQSSIRGAITTCRIPEEQWAPTSRQLKDRNFCTTKPLVFLNNCFRPPMQ